MPTAACLLSWLSASCVRKLGCFHSDCTTDSFISVLFCASLCLGDPFKEAWKRLTVLLLSSSEMKVLHRMIQNWSQWLFWALWSRPVFSLTDGLASFLLLKDTWVLLLQLTLLQTCFYCYDLYTAAIASHLTRLKWSKSTSVGYYRKKSHKSKEKKPLATLRCSSEELFLHLGRRRFSLREVASSRCAWCASASSASLPIMAAVSHHLPVTAPLFLPSSVWFAGRRSDDGSLPSN